MSVIFQTILAILVSLAASSGFWKFVQNRSDKEDGRTRMLIGLGHDRIIYLGMSYVERGYITEDEYENLHDYLYMPYHDIGGNGSAERIMQEVNKLKIVKSSQLIRGGNSDEKN